MKNDSLKEGLEKINDYANKIVTRFGIESMGLSESQVNAIRSAIIYGMIDAGVSSAIDASYRKMIMSVANSLHKKAAEISVGSRISYLDGKTGVVVGYSKINDEGLIVEWEDVGNSVSRVNANDVFVIAEPTRGYSPASDLADML